jgi:hypothetical protein
MTARVGSLVRRSRWSGKIGCCVWATRRINDGRCAQDRNNCSKIITARWNTVHKSQWLVGLKPQVEPDRHGCRRGLGRFVTCFPCLQVKLLRAMRTAFPQTQETGVGIFIHVALYVLFWGVYVFGFYELMQPHHMRNPGLPPPIASPSLPPLSVDEDLRLQADNKDLVLEGAGEPTPQSIPIHTVADPLDIQREDSGSARDLLADIAATRTRR